MFPEQVADDDSDRLHSIPHRSLSLLHAFLETPTADPASSFPPSSTATVSFICGNNVGPLVAGAIAAARVYNDSGDMSVADGSRCQHDTEIPVDADGDPVYLEGTHASKSLPSTARLACNGLQCCCVSWVLVVAVLLLAAGAWCSESGHQTSTHFTERMLNHAASTGGSIAQGASAKPALVPNSTENYDRFAQDPAQSRLPVRPH